MNKTNKMHRLLDGGWDLHDCRAGTEQPGQDSWKTWQWVRAWRRWSLGFTDTQGRTAAGERDRRTQRCCQPLLLGTSFGHSSRSQRHAPENLTSVPCAPFFSTKKQKSKGWPAGMRGVSWKAAPLGHSLEPQQLHPGPTQDTVVAPHWRSGPSSTGP